MHPILPLARSVQSTTSCKFTIQLPLLENAEDISIKATLSKILGIAHSLGKQQFRIAGLAELHPSGLIATTRCLRDKTRCAG